MTQYKAGIIGLGFIGGADQVSGDGIGQQVPNLDGTHLFAYQNHDRVDLIAGSSRDRGRRDRFAARTGARTYEQWTELIAKEDLDIISIATYAPQHAEIATACAEAGIKAIYCEKPIATTLDDAERMIAASEKAGSLLVMNHQKRFRLNHRRLRDEVAAGRLGELTSVNLQWGNGRLGNVGTHMIDGLIMLTGRRVERASANLDLAGKPDCRGTQFRDPGGWGTLILEGNLRVTVDAADFATTPACITLNGTLGRAFVTPADDIRIDTYGVADQEEGTVKREASTESWKTAPNPTGMDRAVDEIVQHLNGTPFPYAVEEARLTFETIVAMHASHARNGAFVDLPLTDDDRLHEILSG